MFTNTHVSTARAFVVLLSFSFAVTVIAHAQEETVGTSTPMAPAILPEDTSTSQPPAAPAMMADDTALTAPSSTSPEIPLLTADRAFREPEVVDDNRDIETGESVSTKMDTVYTDTGTEQRAGENSQSQQATLLVTDVIDELFPFLITLLVIVVLNTLLTIYALVKCRRFTQG